MKGCGVGLGFGLCGVFPARAAVYAKAQIRSRVLHARSEVVISDHLEELREDSCGWSLGA